MIRTKENTDYVENQENLGNPGFGEGQFGFAPFSSENDLVNSDNEIDTDVVYEDNIIFASESYNKNILKFAKTILSKNSDPANNIFDEDIRFSKKIRNHNKIIVNKTYSNIIDYKNIIDNFHRNASSNSKLYIKGSKFSGQIRRYANENGIEYANLGNSDVLTKGDSDSAILKLDSDLELNCFVAESVVQKMEGLQGFKELSDNECMIFPYGSTQSLMFHMGTVSFAIDIIFCKKADYENSYEVVKVFENIQPNDLGLYGSEADMVVEVRGNLSSEIGMVVGSRFEISYSEPFDSNSDDEDAKDIYFLEDMVSKASVRMKIAGIGKSFSIEDISSGASKSSDGHKIYISKKASNFVPINDNFILVHNLNISNSEARNIFNSSFPGYKYDILRISSRDPILLSKISMDTFGCKECRVFDMSISKTASFPIPEDVINATKKIDLEIIDAIRIIKNINEDIVNNKNVYEKFKDKAEAIKNSKGAYRQSMARISKKVRMLLEKISAIISALDNIKDTNKVEDIIGSVLVTTQNNSKFFKRIVDLQNQTEDLNFFNTLSKESDDFGKISEDLDTVLKRCRNFLYVDILGKSLLTE